MDNDGLGLSLALLIQQIKSLTQAVHELAEKFPDSGEEGTDGTPDTT